MHIAAECFMREFWSLEHVPLQLGTELASQFASAGIQYTQDLPHCELLPEDSRICFMRANEVG